MGSSHKRFGYLSISAFSALSFAALCSHAATVQPAPQVLGNAIVNESIQFDLSRPLVELLAQAAAPQGNVVMHPLMRPKNLQMPAAGLSPLAAAAAVNFQALIRPFTQATIGRSFEGVGQTSVLNCPDVALITVVPPDTNAAVGDTQVVQWVNDCYAIFNKSTGALVAGPLAGNNFWKGFGGPCETYNDGDPIIQWDKANHRWVAAQNVFSGPPYYTCVAVSKTADAAGGYFRYVFPQQAGFPDYPKWGLSRGVYYQTQNIFSDTGFLGVNVCAYDGKRMLEGSRKARQVCIFDNSNGTLFDDSMLPADDDSASEDSGSAKPEVLLGAIDNFFPGGSYVYEFVFAVDFENPAHSTLTGIDGSMPISVPPYILALCPDGAFITTYCVPQPTPGSDVLDTLGDRLMYRLARMTTGEGEEGHGKVHFLVNHSVNDTTAVAARWYEFRAAQGSTTLSLYQTGQTPDDGKYRWMGSIAMDKIGDIALGYSRSSAASGDYPSIYYAGQQAGDPRGTMEGEVPIKKGGGSQLNSYNRWGDYSSMALDGADSCTFWYTNEYYPTDGSFTWATWLASLKFPHCHADD